MPTPPPRSTLFPYTTLFRSMGYRLRELPDVLGHWSFVLCERRSSILYKGQRTNDQGPTQMKFFALRQTRESARGTLVPAAAPGDRKSTRLNSSHVEISYAVF